MGNVSCGAATRCGGRLAGETQKEANARRLRTIHHHELFVRIPGWGDEGMWIPVRRPGGLIFRAQYKSGLFEVTTSMGQPGEDGADVVVEVPAGTSLEDKAEIVVEMRTFKGHASGVEGGGGVTVGHGKKRFLPGHFMDETQVANPLLSEETPRDDAGGGGKGEVIEVNLTLGGEDMLDDMLDADKIRGLLSFRLRCNRAP